MPELQDPFIGRVPEGDRKAESGELSYEAAHALAHQGSVETGSVWSEEKGLANERAWREELQATLAEEPKTQGAEYYAALERFLNGDTSEEQLS